MFTRDRHSAGNPGLLPGEGLHICSFSSDDAGGLVRAGFGNDGISVGGSGRFGRAESEQSRGDVWLVAVGAGENVFVGNAFNWALDALLFGRRPGGISTEYDRNWRVHEFGGWYLGGVRISGFITIAISREVLDSWGHPH